MPGSRVSGIAGEAAVEILSARAYGPDTVEVAWKGPDSLGERILFRDGEPRLGMTAGEHRFTFDGEGQEPEQVDVPVRQQHPLGRAPGKAGAARRRPRARGRPDRDHLE